MLLAFLLASGTTLLLPATAQGDRSYRLNGRLPRAVGGDVDSPLVSPDGTKVVYRVDLLRENAFQLFSAPVERQQVGVLGATAAWRMTEWGSVEGALGWSIDREGLGTPARTQWQAGLAFVATVAP